MTELTQEVREFIELWGDKRNFPPQEVVRHAKLKCKSDQFMKELDRQLEARQKQKEDRTEDPETEREETETSQEDNQGGSDAVQELEIDKIEVVEEVYPRQNVNQDKVEEYARNFDQITEPIEVARVGGRLLLEDGAHRLEAARSLGHATVRARVDQRENEREVLIAAIRKNANHGMMLSMEDKKALARELHTSFDTLEELADVLSVSLSSVSEWTKEQRQKQKRKENDQIRSMDDKGRKNADIARELGMSESTVSRRLKNMKKSGQVSAGEILHYARNGEMQDEERINNSSGSDEADDSAEADERTPRETAEPSSGEAPEDQTLVDTSEPRQKTERIREVAATFRRLLTDDLSDAARKVVTEELRNLIERAMEVGVWLDLAEFTDGSATPAHDSG